MKDLFAKCGNNCGGCPGYYENAKTEADRQWCSDGWHRYLGARVRPDLIHCQGCQAPDPWKSGDILPNRGCAVRPCVVKMGVTTCAHCPEYPCEDLRATMWGADIRERIAAWLGEPIPEADYIAFIKPYEALVNLAEIRASLAPEDIAEKVEVRSLRARCAPFPDDLPLPKRETAALKALHTLMSQVLFGQADTWIRQELLKRRRHIILNLLWVFGRFGEFAEDNGKCLIISGAAHGARDDFRNIIRRRDGALHTTAEESFRILRDFGVRGEHVPQAKKMWLLKMALDESAGGAAALEALQRYTTQLVEQHGEPEYAGRARYKGEAYARFSKADMGVFEQG